MSHIKEFEHLKIPLEAIILATNNFSDENCIGKGGFAKVYKGENVHSKGQSMVAFKRLDRAFGEQGNPEFWKEIMMLSVYKHENIVSLLGFCDESDEKILAYEYAPKGSLDLYLKNDDLSWIQRLKICIGAARGLAYLHNPVGTQPSVLHRDVKSSNILLDENWNAKISDFGLSNPVGKTGYCDPLYVENGFLTKESDVYSFGVVLFEVLCGRLCVSNIRDNKPLTKLVRESYEENKINEIIHGNLKDGIDHHSLKLFTVMAYQCLKRDHEERPLMAEIVRILETALEYQASWLQQSNHQQGGINGGENLNFQTPLAPPQHGGANGDEGSIQPGSMVEPMPEPGVPCPRCDSTNTKFCYFNNYNLTMPRHFCKTCRRYWTRGGALRNVPVRGGVGGT